MREIKFRAWDNFNEEYYYSEKTSLSMFFRMVEKAIEGENKLTVEQYTGLKDNNGTEIYEGDIIDGINGRNYRIIFMYGSFDINDPLCCDFCKDGESSHGNLNEYLATSGKPIEIIGNIHENPELIDHA